MRSTSHASSSGVPPIAPQRTPSASPAVHTERSVYEAWEAFGFDATLGAFQKTFSEVVDSTAAAATDKAELVSYVTALKRRTHGKDTLPSKELEECLAFFKRLFSNALSRAHTSEQAFSQLFERVGRLPDPTPVLSSNNVLAAKVVRLEKEREALAEASTEAVQAVSLSKETQAELARLRTDLENSEQSVRRRSEELEALTARLSDMSAREAEASASHNDLEERYLQITDELSSLRTEGERRTELTSDEVTHLSQLLADRDLELSELKRKGGAEPLESSRVETAELRCLQLENSLQTERSLRETAEIETTRLLAEGARRDAEAVELKRTLLTDPAAEQEKRMAKLQKIVRDLGDLGDVCFTHTSTTNNIDEALRTACDEQDIIFALRSRIRALVSICKERDGATAKAEQTAFNATQREENLVVQLSEADAKISSMRARLDTIVSARENTTTTTPEKQTGFDLGNLVEDFSPEGELRIDIAGGDTEVTQLLMTQRDTLNERILELQKHNARLQKEVYSLRSNEDNTGNKARQSASPGRRIPQVGGGGGGGGGAGGLLSPLDAMGAKTLSLLNLNVYTRRFAVLYVLLLHMLVSVVLWHVSVSSGSIGTKERHSY